ncbi:glycosyltransferase [Neobacillus cucumis]|uniref:glycosyltransferase n=1 Tax=Neobacillus cucumis TaxID=1740721 RepID=UPI0018DEEF42|nr:glycosyltransferase [Neobacillus cucumis]MBI0577955.1 glycosyltransferase [Neobacillus cucumis]
MKKNLVIIDEFFPFLNKEPFLESEINYYNDANVFIFSCRADKSMNFREIKQKNINVFAEDKEKTRIIKIFRYLNAAISKDFIKEIYVLAKNKKLNFSSLKQLLSFMSVANHKSKWIKKQLIRLGLNKTSEFVLYSYWMHYHAYTALLLKKYFKNSKVVTRCHRYDLYEYVNKPEYIPLRKKVLSQVDEIFSISDNGETYLRNKYSNIKMNIRVSRLGTKDYSWNRETSLRKPMKIVSCSWVVPVKRVERIISSLEKINDLAIEWTHFGDGQLFSEMKQLAERKLKNKNNITYLFKGAISNQDILTKYYEEKYHLFLNVSESEGIPVSIMEAISFGIPVIATNVGGVNEVVIDGNNGYLLDKDFNDQQLIDAIIKITRMSENEYLALKESARRVWEERYNAEKNYQKFVKSILV